MNRYDLGCIENVTYLTNPYQSFEKWVKWMFDCQDLPTFSALKVFAQTFHSDS